MVWAPHPAKNMVSMIGNCSTAEKELIEEKETTIWHPSLIACRLN